MKINVKTLAGNTITLDVKRTDTIEKIKEKIHDMLSVPPDKQKLCYKVNVLEDRKTLADYNIQNECTINAIFILKPGIQIFINTFTGKTFPLDVEPSDPINKLKAIIQDKEYIKIDQQELILDGVVLDGDKTLKDYNIHKEDTIEVKPIIKEDIQIFAKTLSGKANSINVKLKDTLDTLKAKIQEKMGVPPEQQSLLLNGKNLEGNNTLEEYKIQNQSSIYVTLIPKTGMQVLVKTATGQKLTIEVEPTDTIEKLKAKIQKKNGIQTKEQELKYKDITLEDGFTLSDYDIPKESTINLSSNAPKNMQIHVKTLNGKTITLNVEPNETINKIKAKIKDSTGVSPIQQKLSFNNTLLEGWKSLADYNIQNQCSITAIFALKNGINVIVKLSTGKTITITIDPDDTIKAVKERIRESEGFLPAQQELKFGKLVLDDELTVNDYSIQNESTIILTPILKEGMQVFIKTSSGKIITLATNPNDTIMILKSKIQEIEKCPIDQQELKFKEEILKDSITLRDYSIQKDSTIDLKIILKGGIKINIKPPAKKAFTLDVKPTDSIEFVKSKIKEIEGVPPSQQILKYDGQILKDGNTLKDYKIQNDATIDLRNSLTIGMPIFIKHTNGKTFILNVDPEDTISIVKSKIHEKEGILPEQQELKYAEEILEDYISLEGYEIQREATIDLKCNLKGKMQIFIKPWGKNSFPLDVESDDTIYMVKAKIQNKEGTLPDQQELRYEGEVLENGRALEDYGIQNKTTIDFINILIGGLKIYVKDLEGKTITLDVAPRETISSVKSKIQEMIGILVTQQELNLGQLILEDEKTLEDYEIKEETVINLISL